MLTGLVADSSLAGGNKPSPLRRLVSIITLVGGAAVGAFLIREGLALPLFVSGACVLGTTAAYVGIARSSEDRNWTCAEKYHDMGTNDFLTGLMESMKRWPGC
jgi:uncharacterized membrane protein YoaK (UPF0700 family)